MEINLDKTEDLSKVQDRVSNLEIDDNRHITGRDKFKYLDFMIWKNGTTEEETNKNL